MDKQVWVDRCFAHFQKRWGLPESNAIAAAESCLANLGKDFPETPEDAADEDMNYRYEN